MTRIAIIGGGPAGFMAAISAVENSSKSLQVDIYEKSEALKTILYTGNGRCNLTNEIYDYKKLASNYPRGEKFLYSAFSQFGVKETLEFFEKNGVELYTQEDNRVFPKSNDAKTVRNALLKKAEKLGVNIKNNSPVTKIEYINNKFQVYTQNSSVEYDKIIISTGGNYKKPKDSGYDLAESLGHKITELKPSLLGFITKENWAKDLSGISIKNAEIRAFSEQKLITKDTGDFIFTHKGISGPLVFKISAYCAFVEFNKNKPLVLKIDFLPEQDENELEESFRYFR